MIERAIVHETKDIEKGASKRTYYFSCFISLSGFLDFTIRFDLRNLQWLDMKDDLLAFHSL